MQMTKLHNGLKSTDASTINQHAPGMLSARAPSLNLPSNVGRKQLGWNNPKVAHLFLPVELSPTSMRIPKGVLCLCA